MSRKLYLQFYKGYCLGLTLAILLLTGVVVGQEARNPEQRQSNPASRFIRIVKGADGSMRALELAIVRYGHADCDPSCQTVDLISVVHLADSGFYHQIDEILPRYDVVLFEYVARDSTDHPATVSPEHEGPLHKTYKMACEVLGLQGQHEGIDYSLQNMLHADLTKNELEQVLEEQGDSLPDFQELLNGFAKIHQAMARIDQNIRCKLRRKGAIQLMQPARDRGLFGDLGIIPRNRRALQVLKGQLSAGRMKIAILYGAAHMPDLQAKLISDFDMLPLKRRWLEAWDLCAY